mgnify:CR=1 FL=1
MLKYFILLLTTNFILMAQSESKTDFNLQNFKIYFDNLKTSWKPDEDNIDIHSLSIKDYTIGFSKIDIKNIYMQESYISEFQIIGPELILNNFEYNSKLNSKNWIIEEKIKMFKKRESIPKDGIEKIVSATKLYVIDNNILPSNLNELVVKNYINLNQIPFNKNTWIYSLNLPKNISATPSHLNINSASDSITYNWEEEKFQNSPFLDSMLNIPKIEWNYDFKIQKITQFFSSNINFSVDPQNNDFNVQIKKGLFRLENLNFTATPGKELKDKIHVKLPILKLDLTDFNFEGSFIDTLLIQNLKSNFKIRNFEIKLPEGLIKEPEIETVLKTLGIWNNSLKVRLFEIDINLINELTGDAELKLHTPFLKLSILANFSIRQNNSLKPIVRLNDTKIVINPIALGVRKYIRRWEKENNKTLNRKGSSIFLTVNGELNNLFIHGLND